MCSSFALLKRNIPEGRPSGMFKFSQSPCLGDESLGSFWHRDGAVKDASSGSLKLIGDVINKATAC